MIIVYTLKSTAQIFYFNLTATDSDSTAAD